MWYGGLGGLCGTWMRMWAALTSAAPMLAPYRLQPPPSKQVKDLTLTDRMHEMLAATMAPADEATAKV